MNEMEVKLIPFNGNNLLGVKTEDGNVWLAIRKASIDIGLNENQADNEVKKVKSNVLFENNWINLPVKFDGQVRNTLVLVEKFVPMWLAQIRLTPTMKRENPEVVSNLLEYQLNAADVLHKAFYETEEQKEALHNDLGLTGRIEGMQVQINAMEDLLGEQTEMLNKMVENMTLSTRQQQKLYKAAKDRINKLLDGAHGTKYKCYSKSYFINMWNELKEKFGCSSYKDLNPMYYNEAFDFIAENIQNDNITYLQVVLDIECHLF